MRRNNGQLREISIKVPGPFAGISDLGFTTQYRAQEIGGPMCDVPVVIEGPRPPMRRLVELLQVLHESNETAYAWTDPILVSDEVALLAFRDRSLSGNKLGDGATALSDHVLNVIRPVVFPFLHDCAAIARLRLSDVIEMRLTADQQTLAALAMPISEIVESNGDRLLWQVAG